MAAPQTRPRRAFWRLIGERALGGVIVTLVALAMIWLIQSQGTP